jgi:predicted metal-dependent peptidase
MSIPKIEEKGWIALQQARGYVKQKFPYFYTTLLGLIPRHVKGIKTMFVTETMVLGIDMEWFCTLTPEVAGGCLCHEVMHILRDITRLAPFPNQELAGRAFDIPINDDLAAAGVQLPDWVIYSDTYKLPKGLTGEKYYELLGGIQFPNEGTIGNGRCGSCDGYTIDKITIDDPGRLPVEVMHFRKQGLQAIREHVAKGSFGRGRAPGSIMELLEFDGTEQAVIPWAQITSSTLHRSFGRIVHGHSDYSLRRPAKRSYALGILRPGLVGYSPTVCFMEDSSGSMGGHQLKSNRVEVCQMMHTLGITEVWFIASDADVHGEPKLLTINELMEIPVTGRGGTNFCPAIETMVNIRPRPDLAIYSTDGDGDAPDYPPLGIEFIWLLAPGPWTRSPCNWGIQILTTDDPEERKEYELLT